MKRILSVTLVAALLATTGCQNWLDINDNPNYTNKADMCYLMPSAELYIAQEVGYNISLYSHFWSQYVNQSSTTNQYYTIMTCNVKNSSWDRVWSNLYTKALPSIKEVVTKANATEYSENYLLQSKTLEAYVFYLLTSLYDKVAYTKGYMAVDFQPTFDSGEEMQKNLISMFEEIRAIDMDAVELAETVNSTAGADMIFGGDNESWLQFANTLYLKVMMRDFDANKAEIRALLDEDNFLQIDAAFDNFADEADKSNPFYENDRRQLNTMENIRACTDILNVLSEDDPRLDFYYEKGGCYGANYGITTKPTESGRLALQATDPVYFGTVDEAEFLKAEAYAKLGNPDMAEESYDNAIIAAFDRTVGADAAYDFIAEGGDYEFDPDGNMVEQIINQKWASNVKALAWESWFDLSRTGYPTRGETITDYSGELPANKYPCRFIYSKNSADNNPNSPEPQPVYEKMWWQKGL